MTETAPEVDQPTVVPISKPRLVSSSASVGRTSTTPKSVSGSTLSLQNTSSAPSSRYGAAPLPLFGMVTLIPEGVTTKSFGMSVTRFVTNVGAVT